MSSDPGKPTAASAMTLEEHGRSYLQQVASKCCSSTSQVSMEDVFNRDLSQDERLALLDSITLENRGEKLDLNSFEKCSTFWRIDLATLFDSTYKHELPFLKIALHPWQLFAIWWMIECESRGITGILADGMGLGKTFSAIVLSIMDHQIALNQFEVAEALEDHQSCSRFTFHIKPSEHASRKICGQNKVFQCACVPGSLASVYRPTGKATVFCTTAILTYQWIQTFDDLVDQEKAGVQLYHTRTNERLSGATELTTDVRQEIRERQESDDPTETTAAIIVTNYDVFHTRIVEYHGSDEPPKSKEISKWKHLESRARPDPALPLGRLFVDEPYTCVTTDHSVINSLNGTMLKIRIWLINATIVSNRGLEKIQSWLALLHQHNQWFQSTDTHNNFGTLKTLCRPQDLSDICNDFLQWIDSGNQIKFDQSMQGVARIIEQITLQRTASTIWPDGKPILVLPSLVERSFDLTTPSLIGYLNRVLFSGKQVHRRCVATFPGAARDLFSGRLKGTMEDHRARQPIIEESLADYTTTSPKFCHFIQLYNGADWLSQKEAFSAANDNAEMQTLLFFNQPWSATVWYWGLCSHFNTDSAYLISSETTKAQRLDTLQLFGSAAASDSATRKLQKSARFLCTTYAIAAPGLNICGPVKVILVEPSNEQMLEAQAVARCWRYGQRRDVEVIRYTMSQQERSIATENFRVAVAAQVASRRLRIAY